MNKQQARPSADRASGEAAMSRLADRLTAMAPPPMNLQPSAIVRPVARRQRRAVRPVPQSPKGA